MKARHLLLPLVVAGLVVGTLFPAMPLAAQPKADTLTVTDAAGKEFKITGWKFTSGTVRLNWLASDAEKKDAKDLSTIGPEVLEFTEGKEPPLVVRVLTWVPLKSVRSIEFDAKKEHATVKVAVTADMDVTLEGPMGYQGTNRLSIEAEEDLGELGKAEIKVVGGTAQGVKSITFPGAVPLGPLPKGRPAQVTTTDKNNKSFAAVDLMPLHRVDKEKVLKLEPNLLFQKTVDIAVDKIEQISHSGEDVVKGGHVFTVKLKSGKQHPLVLKDSTPTSHLLGLVGRVEVGYKLIPMPVLEQVTFDAAGSTAPKDKDKDKDEK